MHSGNPAWMYAQLRNKSACLQAPKYPPEDLVANPDFAGIPNFTCSDPIRDQPIDLHDGLRNLRVLTLSLS